MSERISCDTFKALFADSCPLFVTFLEPQIQSAIDQSLQTSAHQGNALRTNKSMRGLHKLTDMLYQEEALPDFRSIACLQLEIDIGES